MITPYKPVEAGQYWYNVDTEMMITEVKQVDNDVWIYYKNVKTGQQYHCLEAAFRSRFYLIANRG